VVRRAEVGALALAMPSMLAGGAGSGGGHFPLPTATDVRTAVVLVADWATGKTPPKPAVPAQQSGTVPGEQHPVPASVTQAIARAQGYKPGTGAGQLPAYAFPAAKVTQHVTGPADLGGPASFSPAASKPVAPGAATASTLYQNADGSYTRLEDPQQAAAGQGAVTFTSLADTGVEGARVTSVALRVHELWASRCPSSATVSVTDAAGQQVGRWTGRPPASACGSGSSGGWVTVPLSSAGVKALSAKGGATLTVTATPAASRPAQQATPATSAATTPTSTATAPAPATPGPSPADAAVLQVTAATTAPPQVNGQWPPDGYNAPSLTPELIASGQTFDGSQPLYQFAIYDSTGTWLTGTQWQASDDWVVPAGTLAWAQTYYWTVQVFDGSGTGSPTPQAFALSTPVPQPLVSSTLVQDGTASSDTAGSAKPDDAASGDTTGSSTAGSSLAASNASSGTTGAGAGPGFDAQNGNFTNQATDASVPVTGPALSVQRTYNSLSGSTSGAFGAGWSSAADMTVRPGRQAIDGSAATQIVTYPDGEQVAFGQDAGGQTFTAPQGRYGTLIPTSGSGFQLVDKGDATYTFSQSLGSNTWGITSVADAQDHALDFTYSGGHVTRIESMVSQRSLYLTWSTPSGAAHAHVATVATDPVTPGTSSSAITWQYSYSGDQLAAACNESQSGTPCTKYSYTTGSDYPSAVLDSGPQSYWRLDETSGTSAAGSVLANESADNATYTNVSLNATRSPLAGEPSSVGAVSFDGTNAYARIPASLGDDGAVMSVSLWFDTGSANDVLLSQSADPITDSSSTNPYTPILYVGADGKLRAGFAGTGTPLSSTSAVDNSTWHNVVLTSTGSQETLWIDDSQVASTSVTVTPFVEPYMYLGAGFLGGSNPDEANAGKTPAASFYSGALSDAAIWDRALTGGELSTLSAAALSPAALVNTITRPSAKNFEQATYNAATSHVTAVTDSNGGSWTVSAPSASGTSQVYTAAVKGGQPVDYWRLGDTGTTTAVNQLNGGTATYSNVTQGVSGGPFADTTVDGFNGTSSYLSLPGSIITPGNESVSLWFKTTGTQEVLLSSSADSPANGDSTNAFTPNLYVGQDGLLNGEFFYDDAPMESSTAVNDGKWHNVVMTSDADDQYLYLDGIQIASVTGQAISGGSGSGQDQVAVGTGFLGYVWADQSHYSTTDPTGFPSFFTGDIADVAVYPHLVSAGDVTAQWAAAQHSAGLSPVETATVADPGQHTLTYRYDPVNGGRMLSQTDGLGYTTTYGYDSGGFQDQVVDPDGDFTDSGYDIRGNLVATTTCQDQATLKCSTSYTDYLPDDKSSKLQAPWSGNDLVQTYRDPRSSSATDNTYLTTDKYDASGDLVSSVGPPVPGFPSGQTTTYQYTDGTTTYGSADGSVPPAGLLWKTVSPAGAVTQTLYNAHGDIMDSIDANGVTTRYAYDGIGRKTSQTVISDTEPNGLTTSYSYNANGQVTQETDPGTTDRVTGAQHIQQITTAYDPDGDVTSQVTADIGPAATRDASRTESYTYNTHDQKASYTDGANAVTSYTYDAYGNQATKKDAGGNVTAYTYDPNGRLLTTTLQGYTGSPAGSQSAKNVTEESRAYDPAGRLASVTDGMGRVTAYTYTDDGLTASVTHSGPGSNGGYVQEKDTYDPDGNLVTKVTNNGATTTDYTVDAAKQVTGQTVDPDSLDRVTSYTYDGDNHVLTQDVSQGGNAPIQSTSYTYDPMGNKTSQTVQDPNAEGPAAWWTLTQGSGTSVTDSSGTGNQATATGVTWTGGGAQFSGQGGQDVTTRGPVVDTTGSFSVSAWVNLAGFTGTDETAVSQDAGSVAGFYLEADPDTGTWTFELPEEDQNDPPDWAFATGSAPKTNTWVFLTGVYDVNTGEAQLYVNGTEAGEASDSSPIASHGPVEIGADRYDGQSGGDNFDGTVTNVEMYPTALSAAEVGNLYGQTRNGGDLVRGALTTDYTLDQLGQVVAQTDPDEVTTTYEYDAAGHQTTVTGPAVATQSAGGTPAIAYSVTTTGYDTFGDTEETQDADGNVTSYTYDGDGRQLTKTLPSYTTPGGTAVNGTSQTQYNGLGQATSQTDPDNNQTTYTYDQLGDKTSQTDVTTGGTTAYAYDLDKELLSQTGPTGAQTTSTYDFLGRQVTTTDVERYLTPGSGTPSSTPASYTTTTSYAPTTADPSGTWKSSVSSPDGVTTHYGYDAVGENTQVTDAAGNVTTYAFDALGRQVKTVNPDQTADTVAYDPAGNKIAQASLDKNGNTLTSTSATYNGEGDQLSTTDARGDTTMFTYDPMGRMTAETQPVTGSSGIVTSFGYDAAGNQTLYTDGNGNQTLTTYTSRNLPQTQVEPSAGQYTSPANSTTTITYNGDGNATGETEPGGVALTYSYDSLNDVTGQTGSGAGAPTATRAFTFDTAGRMLTASTTGTSVAGATSETFTYDDRGMVTGATGSAGTTSLGYNGDGQPTSVQDAAGTNGYSYDGDGRLQAMNDPASGATLTYSYNPMSQPSTIAYGGSGADTQTFGYNSLHQTTSDTLASGSTTVASIGYQYDPNGDLTTKTTSNFGGATTITNTYTYDQADRLASWNNGTNTTTYAYDADGNRTQVGSTTYTYDARDELTSDGTNNYSYTANGDLSSVSGTSTTTTSTSDAYGQQGTQGSQTNTYDALGRDVQLTNGSSTTKLSYQDTTGQLTSDGTDDYTWTPSGTLTGSETTTAPGAGVLDLTDTHTNVTGQFKATGTTLTGSQNFGPWGTVTATGGSLTGSLGYQSQYTSPATGQTDMGARWYNPATGSFGNKDTVSNKPVPNSASASPFGYAADNPLDATDPSGHTAAPTCPNGANISACIQNYLNYETATGTSTSTTPAKAPTAAAPAAPKAAAPTCPNGANISACIQNELSYQAANGSTPAKAPAAVAPTVNTAAAPKCPNGANISACIQSYLNFEKAASVGTNPAAQSGLVPPFPRKPDYVIVETDYTWNIGGGQIALPGSLFKTGTTITISPDQSLFSSGGTGTSTKCTSLGLTDFCVPGIVQTTKEPPGKQNLPGPTIYEPGATLKTGVPVKVTVSVSIIVARNGHVFLSLGLGVSPSSDEAEPSVKPEVTASVRDGWFGDPNAGNFTSSEIDSYIKGPYLSVSGTTSTLGLGAAVSKALPGGYSYEFGAAPGGYSFASGELLGPSAGVSVSAGYTFPLSNP
jgi:RHS repeat-associated protein